jgi:diketogulonate reductase-like aldo/keto reductase
MNTYLLHNGLEIPAIGFGTFPMRKAELIKAVWTGVAAGYRLFDTACAYRNEFELGLAMNGYWGRKKSESVVTTIISNRTVERKTSRRHEKKPFEFGTEPVDLYLIHWRVSPIF